MMSFAHIAVLLSAFAQTAPSAPPRLTIEGCQSKKFRFISLAEARALALDHGIIDQPALLFPGIGLDNQVTGIRVLAGGKSGSKSIVITGIRRDSRPAEAERNINQTLLNTENAYWNLYGSYWQLYSREQGLRLAHETWKLARSMCESGKIEPVAVAQAEGQYNLFRSQYLQAFDTVLDNERQLRAMMGLGIDDGFRLVPCDAPSLVEKKPDWKKAIGIMLKTRPELYLARKDVSQAKDKVQQEEALDCSFRRLPKLVDSENLRRAKNQLTRAYLVQQDQELKAERFLGLYYRRMSTAYMQIKAARAQREAFAKQLQVRDDMFRKDSNEPGTQPSVPLNLLLEAQRFWAESLATEYQAIVTYNNALAGWEYAKSTIMKYAHVRLGSEPSEGSKLVRAAAREQKRTLSQVRYEPGLQAESPLAIPECCHIGDKTMALSLPALWKRFPPLKLTPELPSSNLDKKDEPAEIELTAWKVSDVFAPPRSHAKTKH